MTRKTIARNSGNSGRVNISGSELEMLEAEIGDDVDVTIADSKEVAHALIDSKDTDRFLMITPQ
jgi:antitoxin component of MazEF toxin-antitoxin module